MLGPGLEFYSKFLLANITLEAMLTNMVFDQLDLFQKLLKKNPVTVECKMQAIFITETMCATSPVGFSPILVK